MPGPPTGRPETGAGPSAVQPAAVVRPGLEREVPLTAFPQIRGTSLLVREGGVEPPHPFGYTDLNRARLPIPPLALAMAKLARSVT
jgi:hypothetical protein